MLIIVNPALMAAIWLGAGIVLCLITGPFMSAGSRREPDPAPVVPTRSFASLELVDWVLAADRLALESLQAAPEPVPAN